MLTLRSFRRDRVRRKVESLLQQQATARQQQQQLHMAQQRQQAAARLAAVRQQELEHTRAGLQAQRQWLLARCEGVTQAAGDVVVLVVMLLPFMACL